MVQGFQRLYVFAEDHRTGPQLGGRPPAEVPWAPGGQLLWWVPALSVGALCSCVLSAHTDCVSWSNEIFKEHYKSVIFKEIQSEFS